MRPEPPGACWGGAGGAQPRRRSSEARTGGWTAPAGRASQRGSLLKHGVAPATVCLRRAMNTSRVELRAGSRRRGLPSCPAAASLLHALSSEDEEEASPGAPPLPSAGCLSSAACMLGPGARYWNADSAAAPLWSFVSADAGGSAGGSATASTRAMVAMTDLRHGVAGAEGIAHGPTQGGALRARRHEEGKAGSGAGSGRKCEGREAVPLIKQALALLRPLDPLLLRGADRQRVVEQQAVCLCRLRCKDSRLHAG